MWTAEHRKRYDRSQLHYPSELTDDEWCLILPAASARWSSGKS